MTNKVFKIKKFIQLMRKCNMQSEEPYFSPYPFSLSFTLVNYNQPKGGDYNIYFGKVKKLD
jgi:hypothetical protein